jgi:hypothetical protein
MEGGFDMRSVLGLVGLLIAMAIVLMLAARQTHRSVRAVNAPIPSLREDVRPQAFDRTAAESAVNRLEELVDAPAPPEAELVAIRDTAAGWAAATQPGTGEYRGAVKIRQAADALLEAVRGDATGRATARRLLADAHEAMENPAAMPGGAVGAIRDQLENLQQSQREKIHDAEREAP